MTLEVKTVGTTALLAAAAAASAGSASAADLYTKAQPTYVPAPSSWQGFYVGAGIGASWLNSEQDDSAANAFGPYGGLGSKQTANAVGFVGTLQAGYNFQDRNFVYGVEGDISWISGKSKSSGSLIDYNGYTTAKSSKIDALATFRARFGIDFGGTMPYLTAGVAVGDIKNSYHLAALGGGPDFNVSKSSWQPGVVVGGGIEHKFANSPWSIKGEVLWVGFKDTNVGPAGPGATFGPFSYSAGSVKFSNSMTLGKLGLNYRF